MSFDALQISCTGCDYEANELFAPLRIVYRLEDGREFVGRTTNGWCYCCESYGRIEHIDFQKLADDIRAVEIERKEVRDRLVRLAGRFLARFRGRTELNLAEDNLQNLECSAQELEILIKLARQRNGCPRCLRCWSEETVPIGFDASDDLSHNFKHVCGGMLRIGPHPSNLRVNFGSGTTCYVLTPEGELIEKRLEVRKYTRRHFCLQVLTRDNLLLDEAGLKHDPVTDTEAAFTLCGG